MADIEDQLEADLLNLGRQELNLERKIAELRVTAKKAVQEGRFSHADETCTLMEKLRSVLDLLQVEIMGLERRLYGLRSRRRR